MRAVLQRVTRASVTVEGTVVGRFARPGIVALVGITHHDGPDEVTWLAHKIRELRIMSGERSVADLGAGVMVVSQFTLYGDARKGRRPTWSAAAPGVVAEPLYEALCAELERLGTRVERGVFGGQMELELVNDGPVTLVLDSAERARTGHSPTT